MECSDAIVQVSASVLTAHLAPCRAQEALRTAQEALVAKDAELRVAASTKDNEIEQLYHLPARRPCSKEHQTQ